MDRVVFELSVGEQSLRYPQPSYPHSPPLLYYLRFHDLIESTPLPSYQKAYTAAHCELDQLLAADDDTVADDEEGEEEQPRGAPGRRHRRVAGPSAQRF